MSITVKVFSNQMLIDEAKFTHIASAVQFASDNQDLGFKVRIIRK